MTTPPDGDLDPDRGPGPSSRSREPRTRPAVEHPRRTGLGPWLNTVGVLVVAYGLATGSTVDGGLTPLVAVTGFAALAAWGVRVFLPAGRARDVLTVLMLVCGSLAAGPTQGLLITPAIIAVAGAGSDRMRPVAFSATLAAVGLAIVAAWVLLTGSNGSFVLGCAGGFGLGIVVGISRRQASLAQLREIALVERSAEVERESERSALLADRAAIARDIHDVLAHSLGGLVIQLDAVEALLENGRVDEARARVGAARGLAADGLVEARRAVATLRDPGQGQGQVQAQDRVHSPDSLADPHALDRLIDAHESLGGRVVVTGRGGTVSGGTGSGGASSSGTGSSGAGSGSADRVAGLDVAHRRALVAVVREALSNARRHAPGETVTLRFDSVGAGVLRVRIANPLPVERTNDDGDPPATAPTVLTVPTVPSAPSLPAGGGQGPLGMRERIADLRDGSTLTAGRAADEFVVEIDLVAATAQPDPADRGSLEA